MQESVENRFPGLGIRSCCVSFWFALWLVYRFDNNRFLATVLIDDRFRFDSTQNTLFWMHPILILLLTSLIAHAISSSSSARLQLRGFQVSQPDVDRVCICH
ncbi:unnamed protein product [Ceratitis capitata]|uniref:(Mediterranean fruit fly) hypothetical protein n=1 Tax=Ceratitis capitata TaxID=7213 RepID=A0A811UC57_CERCA|nr:unnamed protein product [Ceratitis capitata]